MVQEKYIGLSEIKPWSLGNNVASPSLSDLANILGMCKKASTALMWLYFT